MDKFNTLSLGEKLITGGGAAMLIALFLPWYKVSFDFGLGSGSISANGLEPPGALFSVLAVLVALALAGSILASRFGNMQLPDLGASMTWGTLYLAGGAATALLVLIKLINESSSISLGFYIAIIASAAIAYGGYLLYREQAQ